MCLIEAHAGGGGLGERPCGAPGWEALPQCQIWRKNSPPLACTALTMGFQASICSLV
jgi:hypothetical protein